MKTKAPVEPKGVKKPAFNFLKPAVAIALCAVLAAGVGLGVVGGLKDGIRNGNGYGGLPVSSDVGATSATPSMGGTESAPPSSNSDPTQSGTASQPVNVISVELPGYSKNALVYLVGGPGDVILDSDAYVIRFVGYDFDAEFGPRIDFIINNKTKKNIMIHCVETSVNGISLPCNMGLDYPETGFEIMVGPGETEFNVFADSQDLNNYGIKSVAEVGTKIAISELVADWEDNILAVSLETVCDNEGVIANEVEMTEGAVTITEGDVGIYVDELDNYGKSFPLLKAYVKNNTAGKIRVTAKVFDCEANTVDLECDVPAGMTGIRYFSFSNWYLDEKTGEYCRREESPAPARVKLSFVVSGENRRGLFETEKTAFDFEGLE